MTDQYLVGQRITITSAFTDAAAAAFNPTTLEFRIRPPDGVTETFLKTDPAVTNPATGTYKLSYLVEQSGYYSVAIHSTASDQETVEHSAFHAYQTI